MEQRKIIQNATRKNKMQSGGNDVSEAVEAEGNLQDVIELLANIRKNREFIAEYEATASMICEKIEQEMTGLGYTSLQIEEAQTLYVFALYDYGEEEGFVEKLVGCYALEEQTDEELIAKVNETFGTEYTVAEYTDLMQELRDTHVLDENENQEGNIA